MAGLRTRKRANAGSSSALKSLKKPNTGIDFTLDDIEYENARKGGKISLIQTMK